MSIPQASLADPPISGVTAPRPPFAVLVRGLKIAVVSLGLFAASIGGYWGVLQYEGNFHTVAAGVLYRSAQPSKAELAAAVREHGIKSVLNLRGANSGS